MEKFQPNAVLCDNELRLPCSPRLLRWFPLYSLPLLRSRMAPPSATSPSCPQEGGSATWRVSGGVRGDLLPGSALLERLAGQLKCSATWWNVQVGRPQPKESLAAFFTTTVALTTQRPFQLGLREANRRDVVGCPTFCMPAPPAPAYPNTPRGITVLQALARAQNQRTGWPENLFVCSFSK